MSKEAVVRVDARPTPLHMRVRRTQSVPLFAHQIRQHHARAAADAGPAMNKHATTTRNGVINKGDCCLEMVRDGYVQHIVDGDMHLRESVNSLKGRQRDVERFFFFPLQICISLYCFEYLFFKFTLFLRFCFVVFFLYFFL